MKKTSGSTHDVFFFFFRAAVTTLNGSMGGGVAGIIISYVLYSIRFSVSSMYKVQLQICTLYTVRQ